MRSEGEIRQRDEHKTSQLEEQKSCRIKEHNMLLREEASKVDEPEKDLSTKITRLLAIPTSQSTTRLMPLAGRIKKKN